MATTSMATDIPKLSFAKVAASGKQDSVTINAVAKPPVPTGPKDRRNHRPAGPPAIAIGSAYQNVAVGHISPARATRPTPTMVATPASGGKGPLVDGSKTVEGLKGFKLDAKTPSLIVNGTGSTSTERSSKVGNSQTPSDENSQKGDSSSDLGTKPPSLDGKSITSGTTYNVLDEKESLRPDDSASVKAAAEDDDSFSVRGPFLGGSRMGSEVAARVLRLQIGDMPPRAISHILPEKHAQGAVTPQSGSSEQQPVPEVGLPLAAASSAVDGLYQQAPDEKLLEAMKTEKDRLFLLRLEKEVIAFVQNSEEPYIDMPPCNSFCRLLTHKLADYYHMTHSFEVLAGSVRIFRTPFCRVPPPLSGMVTPNSNTPPPTILPKKIMRRGEDGEFALASAGPSKPTSEVGSDGKDKEKPKGLTREEREEKYNKARERIFGSAGPTETNTPENGDGTGVSRESSVSAKDRSSLGKRGPNGRRRRTDDADGFETRTKYQAFYGNPQQQNWGTPHYVPVGNNSFNGPMVQATYPNPIQAPQYAAPNQTYAPIIPNNGYGPQVNTMQPYPQQPPPQGFRAPPPPVTAPVPFVPPNQNVPPQSWPANFAQNQFTPRPTPGHVGIPYAYGQLPVNVNPNDPKSQHPIPGSYDRNTIRHGFNPKTQSFVPGGGMSPLQQPPAGPFAASPLVPVPPLLPQIPFSGYQHPLPQQYMPQQHMPQQHLAQQSIPQSLPQPHQVFSGHGDFGMMRQDSAHSMSPYHAPVQHQVPVFPGPGVPHGPPLHHHQNLQQNVPPPSSHIPSKPTMAQGQAMGGGQAFSNLPTYGNPATLPQKPAS